MRRTWMAVRLALAFGTILPVAFRAGSTTDADLARSRFALPLVGLLIGLTLAGIGSGCAWLRLSAQITSFLLVAFSAIVTGGLHLDGLADLADGLFLGGGPERRLAVLKEPQVGSFGVLALGLVLLGKFAALEGLGDRDRCLAVVGASVIGRCLVPIAAGLARYARQDGTGRILVEATHPAEAALAVAMVLVVGGVALGGAGLLGGLGAIAVALGITGGARRRLGGVTGDVLGAVIEVGELAFLLAVSAAVGRG